MMGNIDILSIIKPLRLHLGSCHQEEKNLLQNSPFSLNNKSIQYITIKEIELIIGGHLRHQTSVMNGH